MNPHSVIVERKKEIVESLQKYPPFLTYQQVAEILAVPISFVYKLAHKREIPRVVLGKRTVRVPKKAVIKIVLERWNESFDEAWRRYKEEQ